MVKMDFDTASTGVERWEIIILDSMYEPPPELIRPTGREILCVIDGNLNKFTGRYKEYESGHIEVEISIETSKGKELKWVGEHLVRLYRCPDYKIFNCGGR